MREHIKLIEQLQSVDLRLHETENALTTLPAQLKSLKQDVVRVETLLESERKQLLEVQNYKNSLDQENKHDQDTANKSKARLAQIRNSKEYMATQRELEASRRSINERDEEILKLMEAIEKFGNSIATHEKELNALKEHVSQEENITEKKLVKLNEDLEKINVERKDLITHIPREILSKYNYIQKRKGHAIVEAKGGVCAGCHMHIPPQLYNLIQSGDRIETCPSCQRIIYYIPIEKETT